MDRVIRSLAETRTKEERNREEATLLVAGSLRNGQFSGTFHPSFEEDSKLHLVPRAFAHYTCSISSRASMAKLAPREWTGEARACRRKEEIGRGDG